MRKPCDECPFRREGGVTLRRDRVDEIAGYFTTGKGGTFPCHKTVCGDAEYDDEGGDAAREWGSSWQLCAGGLLFAAAVGTLSDMAQLAYRFRKMLKLPDVVDEGTVCTSLSELHRVHARGRALAGVTRRRGQTR